MLFERADMLRLALAVSMMLLAGTAAAPAQSPATHPDIAALIQQTAGSRLLEQRVFTGDFTGDGQADAVAFIYYEGGGSGMMLRVALFQGEGSRFRFLRNANDVLGENPRQPVFRPGEFQITTTMPRPGDPRCCPTGERRFTVRLAGSGAGGATSPATPAAAPIFGMYCDSSGMGSMEMKRAEFSLPIGGDVYLFPNPTYSCEAPNRCTIRVADGRQWSIAPVAGEGIRFQGPHPDRSFHNARGFNGLLYRCPRLDSR